MTQFLTRASILALSSSAILLSACAGAPMETGMADTMSLGRNAAGEPCTATRSWSDKTVSGLFDASYAIGCRNVAASRSLGFVRVVENKAAPIAAVEATLTCGAASPVTLPAIGTAEARRCIDSSLAAETVAVSFTRNGKKVIGSATPAVLGPLEEALRLLSGAAVASGDGNRATTSAIDLASLAPAPGAEQALAGSGEFDPAIALQQGILLNRKGLHVQASRVLNDALSRLPASASSATRAELSLEAGLADSNIRFTGSAAEHFARADALLAAGAAADSPLLVRKRDTYKALELLNRRQYRAALKSLEQLVSAPTEAGQPLQDAAVVRALNQTGSRNDAAAALAMPSTEVLSQLVIDAQANWARSVAMLALGDVAGAERTLAEADKAFAPLRTERIDQVPVLWLSARLERQRGRLQARKGDFTGALASYDRAVQAMTQSSIGTAGTGNEPAVAELQLERAGIVAHTGASPDVVRAAYDQAVDVLITSSAGGASVPTGIDRYLDLLIAEAGNGARADTYERFFRALQSVGEPAVARQLSQLQSVVTSDPKLGAKVRDRADLERTITRLRYEISAAEQAGGANAAALEAQRQAAEGKLIALNNDLAADQKFSTINDTPATVADLRGALRPGEGYLKISQIGQKAYGVYIDKDATFIYPIEAPARPLAALAQVVRSSIDGRLKTDGKLVAFAVEGAHSLFRLLTGPASESVLRAQALVVDPAGPLQALPAGVLVTDKASVDRYKASRRGDPFDYTGVNFLAETAALSTAVSPRSFLVARSLPPSAASKPFIGFAEHVVPAAGAQFASAGRVDVGNVCSAEFTALRDLASRMAPIDSAEVRMASAALGVPNSPVVQGQEFTDTGIRSRSDLAEYEVLHFATHGLEEGVWGCDKSPPALVTSFGDANSDGLLSFDEIAALRLDANLVVLSACETASGVKDEALARRSGQEEAGSTLEGLVRAFLTANSRAVLATHWQVSAEAETNDLIRSFYSAARQNNIGSALQTAQKVLIAQPEFSHPFYWGAYFVVGDSSKMMLSRSGGSAAGGKR